MISVSIGSGSQHVHGDPVRPELPAPHRGTSRSRPPSRWRRRLWRTCRPRRTAVIEDVLTMRPTPCGIIRAAAALSIRNEPVTFTAITRSNSARARTRGASHWTGDAGQVDQTGHRRQLGVDPLVQPRSPTTLRRCRSAPPARSHGPPSRSSFSTPARPSALMSTRATCQPLSARIRAVTRPIPAGPPAPVMTAVRCSGKRARTVDGCWDGCHRYSAPSVWLVSRSRWRGCLGCNARFLPITVIASLP